jgi:hypothetical protein
MLKLSLVTRNMCNVKVLVLIQRLLSVIFVGHRCCFMCFSSVFVLLNALLVLSVICCGYFAAAVISATLYIQLIR